MQLQFFFGKISFKVTFQSFTVELLYNINTKLLSSFVYNLSFNSVPNIMKRIWVIITICSVIKKTVNAKCLWISTAVAKSEKIRNFTCLSCVLIRNMIPGSWDVVVLVTPDVLLCDYNVRNNNNY